jgi:hypothetical protein
VMSGPRERMELGSALVDEWWWGEERGDAWGCVGASPMNVLVPC